MADNEIVTGKVSDKEKITRFNLIRIQMDGVKPFYCGGLRISDDLEADQQYHCGSRESFQTTLKKRKVEFEILEPRDHASLQQATYRSRRGEVFTIIGLGEDHDGSWKALERLEGCSIPSRERVMGNFEPVKLTVKGIAQDSIVVNTEFE